MPKGTGLDARDLFNDLAPRDKAWIAKQPKDLQRDLSADVLLARQWGSVKIMGKEYKLQPIRDVAVDLLSAPRAIKASTDISAPGRQGLIESINHPIIATKAFGKQMQMLVPGYGARKYEKFKEYLDLHPYIELAEESDLHLTSLGHGELANREEAFLSRILGDDRYFKKGALEKPREAITFAVRASERAYVTYLDYLRINTFGQLAREIHSYNVRKGRPDTQEQYTAIASWINNATGRGDLGKLNDMAPLLGTAFFSPRYWASRLKVMNPAYYAKLPPGARKAAIREMLVFIGAVAAVMAIMKAAGFKVEINPENAGDPDFLKIGAGDYTYDISAGLAPHIRYIARMLLATKNKQPSEEMKDLTSRYVRSKLAPIPGAGVNTLDGKDFIGQPTSAKQEALGLVEPIMIDNFMDAYKADGGNGILKMAPEMVGIGVTQKNKNRY